MRQTYTAPTNKSTRGEDAMPRPRKIDNGRVAPCDSSSSNPDTDRTTRYAHQLPARPSDDNPPRSTDHAIAHLPRRTVSVLHKHEDLPAMPHPRDRVDPAACLWEVPMGPLLCKAPLPLQDLRIITHPRAE